MKLLLTSYKLYNAIHDAASEELSAWLDAYAKKWKVQVRWNLPDGDTEELAALAGVLRGLIDEGPTPKRRKAIQRLLDQVEGKAEATPKPKPKPKPVPRPEADPVTLPEAGIEPAAQAPEAPQEPQEPAQEPEMALAAQITCPTTPAKPVPEDRPAIPPPELRAGALLGSLFGRIQRGE